MNPGMKGLSQNVHRRDAMASLCVVALQTFALFLF